MTTGASDDRAWDAVIAAGVAAQRLVPGSVAVGGTAAALYARHRMSLDTDHLVPNLRQQFERVLDSLEQAQEWKTARVQPPVLILGSLQGVQVGFRNPRRSAPVQTEVLRTSAGALVVPTLDEMIGMKAYLAYSRNTVRDYLDFAALATLAGERATLESLLKSDARYGELQAAAPTLEIAKRLSDPRPYDLDDVNLREYKSVRPEWQSWERVANVCRTFGVLLGKAVV